MDNQNNSEINSPNVNESNNNGNSDEENVVEDSVTLESTRTSGEYIIQEYSIVLNGKENNISMVYTYEIDENGVETVEGRFKNEVLYSTVVMNDTPNKDNIFNANVIRNNFNEDNFNIIKGTDGQNYLTVYNYDYNSLVVPATNLYIFNDSLNLITEGMVGNDGCNTVSNALEITSRTSFSLENNVSPWYENSFENMNMIEGQEISVKIEDNKIYYLVNVIDNYDNDIMGHTEERIYTINHDKLEYEVNTTYNITGIAAGQAC